MSDWKVQHGFCGLLKELKQHGALAVGGHFGFSFYKAFPHRSDNKFGSFNVYYWQPGDHHLDEENNGAHEILVVGAEKIKDKEYIYYIDPNDQSSKSCERRVYKMSYARFEKALFDLYGLKSIYSLADVALVIAKKHMKEIVPKIQSVIAQNANAAVYAFYANETLQIEAVQQYERVMNRIKTTSITLYEKYFIPEKKSVCVKEMKQVQATVSEKGLFSLNKVDAQQAKLQQKISTDYTLLIEEQKKGEKSGLLRSICNYLKCG